jgi:hypothetical protein
MTDEQSEYLLSQEDNPTNYNFVFSSKQDLSGRPSCCRVTTISLLLALLFLVPSLALCDHFGVFDHRISYYTWFIYLFVFNTVMLLWIPEALASTFAYPFSN